MHSLGKPASVVPTFPPPIRVHSAVDVNSRGEFPRQLDLPVVTGVVE